jgi:hypothetical protein
MRNGDNACRDIKAASTESEVIAAVRRYLGSLDASDAAKLPAEVMALGLSEVEEMVHAALQLVHNEMLGSHDAAEAEVLKDVHRVFTTAAKRLADLAKDVA